MSDSLNLGLSVAGESTNSLLAGSESGFASRDFRRAAFRCSSRWDRCRLSSWASIFLSAMTEFAILTVKQYGRPRGANPVPKIVVFEDNSG
jgi:hypothetical protein